MALAGELAAAGTPPGRLVATCRIVMDEIEGRGHQIVGSQVEFVAAAAGLDDAGLQAAVAEGGRGLPLLRPAPPCGRRRPGLGPARLSVDVAGLAAARRTHKSFGPEPLSRDVLLELLSLARHAPNHHLTQPWRFRVLGPQALASLKEAAGPGEAAKLDRAPTLVVVSAALSGDLVQDEEDVCATAAAVDARPARGDRARPRLLLADAGSSAQRPRPRSDRVARGASACSA